MEGRWKWHSNVFFLYDTNKYLVSPCRHILNDLMSLAHLRLSTHIQTNTCLRLCSWYRIVRALREFACRVDIQTRPRPRRSSPRIHSMCGTFHSIPNSIPYSPPDFSDLWSNCFACEGTSKQRGEWSVEAVTVYSNFITPSQESQCGSCSMLVATLHIRRCQIGPFASKNTLPKKPSYAIDNLHIFYTNL